MFNNSKVYLGVLCKRGHKYEGTEKSLRYIYNSGCVDCKSYNQKNYNEKNKEKVKEMFKNHYEHNKEKILQKQKKYSEEHKEEKKTYDIIYYTKNKDIILKRNKQYKKEHLEEVRKYKNEYFNKRYKTDINFKLIRNLRRRMNHVLKGNIKSVHSLELLGCSVEEWKKHLEKTFSKGMTWKNYGEWHIDHIKPLDSFNLLLEKEQRIAFNWKNTQALWKIDNLKKGVIYFKEKIYG